MSDLLLSLNQIAKNPVIVVGLVCNAFIQMEPGHTLYMCNFSIQIPSGGTDSVSTLDSQV